MTSYQHGKSTQITVEGSVVKAKASNFNRRRGEHDVTGYGDEDEGHNGGLRGADFTMSGVYDRTASTGNIAVLQTAWDNDADNEAGALAIVRYPQGNTTGKPKQTFAAVMTAFEESSPVADMVQWTANFKVNGAVALGTVA